MDARRLWLVGGSVWAGVALAFGTVQAASSLAHREYTIERHFSADGVTAIEVDAPDADVTVIGTDGPDVGVRARLHDGLQASDHSEGRVGTRLRITNRCPPLSQFCEASYRLSVPRDLAVRVDAGDGRIEVTGMRAAVRAGGGDVDVALEDLSGPVEASTSDGTITALGLTGDRLRASAGDGEVRTTFAAPPRDVSVTTTDGSVTIVVPDDGSAYAVDLDARDGTTATEVRTDPTSQRRVTARTRDGDVVVRYP